ncbi:DUF669 domain-containing protein [Listeria innocua]
MSTPLNYRVNHQNKRPDIPKITTNGEYEIEIIKCDVMITKQKDPMLSFTHKVRDDVKQDAAGAIIRFDNLTYKEDTVYRLDELSIAAMIPQNRVFETMEELAEELVGKCIRVNVYMRKMTNGTYPRVKEYMQTNHSRTFNGGVIPSVSDFITEASDLEELDDFEESY